MGNKIIVFTLGNPRSASTWSNVPFCLIRELDKRGIDVVGIDIGFRKLGVIYDLLVRRLLKLLYLPFGIAPHYWGRTRWHSILAYKKIKRVVLANEDAELCLFFGYTFYNRYNEIPSLLLSDWPLSYEIKKWKRNPCFLDRRNSEQEKDAITHAKWVVSLFETRMKEMQQEFPDANILFLGGNVVNDLNPFKLTAKDIIEKKIQSNHILFIGKPDRYRDAAKLLIRAVETLNQGGEIWQVDIVGMDGSDIGDNPSWVHCHGFLHKDVDAECALFYKLLLRARMVVNPNPGWAAYSSLIEAMYYYTPVVVSPFDQFKNEFGDACHFGAYVSQPNTQCLAKAIEEVAGSEDKYLKLCYAAHDSVALYTWGNYVNKLLRLIS